LRKWLIEYWRNSPEEKLSGRPAVAPVAQVEVEEYWVFPRFFFQAGDCLFGLGDVRRSDVNGRIVVEESLFSRVISGVAGTRQKALYLCRVLANLVVWVGDHNHLASKVWEVVELPPGLPEFLGTNEMETGTIGVLVRRGLACGEHEERWRNRGRADGHRHAL
jgi:hypothetical protein